MIKNINLFLLIMLFSIGFTSCEKDDQFKPSVSENSLYLQTVHPKDAAEAFKAFKATNLNKSGQSSWITPYFQYNDSISIDNANAHITVTPVTTSLNNAYSRLFSVEINGNIKSVVYHMIPDSVSTPGSFWGKAIITNLSGDIIDALIIEDNYYTGYYDIANHPTTINIAAGLGSLQKTGGGGDDGGNNNDNGDNAGTDSDDWDLGDLDEVTVVGDSGDKLSILVIYRPEIIPDDAEGGISPIPDDTPDEPTMPAGNTNQDGCQPGLIKDENGNCVEPPEDCPDENMIQNDDGDCDCKSGYVEDKDGNCKKKPCENDPVKNPKVAKQKVSGVDGGRYGCTRNGLGCDGQSTKKFHGGLDVLNSYGSPVFAMYDGTATAVDSHYPGAGWISYQTATVNGENITIQYFHLQKENRATGSINAGDIIGYQGDSGNLHGAIEDGYCESHVHIKIKNSLGDTLNPEDYIANLSSDDLNEPTIIDNDCN